MYLCWQTVPEWISQTNEHLSYQSHEVLGVLVQVIIDAWQSAEQSEDATKAI